MVCLPDLMTVLERHGYGVRADGNIRCQALYTLLKDVFLAGRQMTHPLSTKINADTSAELLLNLLLNLYDR